MNLWRVENGQAKVSFHGGQLRAWDSDRRFVFIISGTQAGKTSFGPWWLYREIQRCGPGDYLAVTASFDLFKLKLLPELRMVFEYLLRTGRYWAGNRVLELADPISGKFWAKQADDPMWGRIILRSAQSEGGLESTTALAAWLDECGQDGFTLEDWQAVQRRLSLAQGRVLGTTTPYNLGWLKTEVYDAWADGDPTIDVINFPSTANPAFPPAEYERMRTKMQDWRFNMFYNGILTRPAGLIYSVFTDAMLIDPFPIPDDWQRAVGADFGGANTAILWAAQNPDTDGWVIYKEWLGGGETSADYAKKARAGLPEGATAWGWGGAPSEGQARRDWAAGGFWLDAPAITSVEAGIDRGQQLIKEDRLAVFRTCRGFRSEIGSYRRKLDASGEPTDEIEGKRTFHRMDAYRSLACGLIESTGPWAMLI